MENQEANFIKYADKYRVDPLLLTAIAYHESKYCKAYASWHNQQYKNCTGIMNGGQENGLVAFSTWAESIERHSSLIADYIYQDKRTTIDQIGRKYAPVSSHFLNSSWVNSVSRKYNELWQKQEEK